jgi:hypothetical protein
MERTTNSALRLHRVLLALRGAARDGRPIREVLGEVFDLDPADDLAELEARLNALFAYTARAELDPKLRAVALDILQSLRAALTDYRIHGAPGLQEAVERAVGKLTVHSLRAKKQGAPLNLDYLDRMLDLIIKFETLLAKAHVYLPALTEYLPKLLGA